MRRKLWCSRALLLSFCWLFFPKYSSAQCCSPGNPIGGSTALGVNEAQQWQFFLNYRFGFSGQYFEGNAPASTLFIEEGFYQHVGLIAALGLTERLTVEAETGYFLNKTQDYVEGVLPSRLVGRGLTDLYLSTKVNLWRNPLKETELTLMGGFKLPLGSYQQQYQGALLTRDLQPTTGAYDLLGGFFLYKGFLPQKTRLFLAGRYEYKGQNPDRYRYGQFATLSAFGSYSPGAAWTFLLQLRGEWRDRDTRPLSGNGLEIGNGREQVIPTGSHKLFLVPQVNVALSPDLDLSLMADWPLYQFYFDKQLATTTAVTLSLRYQLRANGGLLPAVP
ncbi:MAG: hypothetical protein AAFR61_16515 [Bacteroidota bacterium]